MTLPLQKLGKLDRMETASIDELRHEQLQRLRWSVVHAYTNVPFYRKAFDDQGLKPMDINSLEDLAKVPFTTKADLRDNYPFGMFATPMSDVVRVHASSGTTGKPTVVGYTQSDINTWADIVARSIRAGGGSRGDKVHVAYGYGLFTGGLGAHYGAERLGCTEELASVHDIVERGASYQRQRAVAAATGGDLVAVVDSVVRELRDSL